MRKNKGRQRAAERAMLRRAERNEELTRMAYARASAWAQSPAGTPYGGVLDTVNATAGQRSEKQEERER